MKITRIGTKISTALISAGAFLATAQAVHAQFNTTQIEPINMVSGGTLSGLIGNIVNIALGFIGIIAVVYLIWGGVTYITAGGDAEKAGKGRIAITNAIIGIIIVVAALVIYNAVIQVPSSTDVNDL